MRRYIWSLLSACCLTFSAWAEPVWQYSIDGNGLPVVSLKGVPVLTGETLFWAENWKWAGCDWTRAGSLGKGAAADFSGKVASLGVAIRNTVTRPAPSQLLFTYVVEYTKELRGVMGGGFQFNIDLASPIFEGKNYAPVLADDKKGMVWDCGQQGKVELGFDPPVASLYFERGQKGQVRAFFVPTAFEPGLKSFTMTLRLPEGAVYVPSLAERYDTSAPDTWANDLFAWDQSPVDLSRLNHQPAGKFGPVRAQGEKLFFDNGQEARFWGCNLQAYALFGTQDQNITVQARRLARLGFNLVRIHHHDSNWTPNVFGDPRSHAGAQLDQPAATTRQLDPKHMEKLDRWIKALKDEGIYVWLDLHVGRTFTMADGIELFDDFAKGRAAAEAKGFCYLNPSVQALMKEFAGQYLGHRNPYTETAYKDEPAIMGVLITNENDVTHHFGNGFLPDKGVPKHNQLFNEDRKRFCDATGADFDKTFQAWVPGESKVYLSDLEHRFNVEMLGCLKGLGLRAPVATTNLWGNCPAYSLPALSDGSIIDTHTYATAEELSFNPHYRPGFLSSIAFGRLAGKPMAITEWNAEDRPGDRTDRFCLPVYVAAVSALQGWNAPMVYGYSQSPLNDPGRLSSWSCFNDPALAGMMPLAALLFREGHVSRAKKSYCLLLDRETLFSKPVSAQSPAVRTVLERSRFSVALPAVKELPWLPATAIPADAEVFTDPARDFIPAGQPFVESDTGELRRDWGKGIQTINTPRSQVASGWIGGELIKTADCEFRMGTPKAVVAAQSLDNQPLAASTQILISLCARVEALGRNGGPPFVSEPVTGELRLRAPAGLKLFPLRPDGVRGASLPATFADGVYTIAFSKPMVTHWFVLAQ